MRKLMLTLMAAGALAVPFGVVVAQDDPVEPGDTTVETDRAQERTQRRQHQHDAEGRCEGDMIRTRTRTQARDEDHNCTGDCDGEQHHERARERTAAQTGG